MTIYTVRRAAKISTRQYENTDVEVTISEDADLARFPNEQDQIRDLMDRCDRALKKKIDFIELGKFEAQSKASRFGV